MCPLINTPPPPEGVIISQPILRFLGVIFDRDHDFEGPRSPKAHLDTVLRNLSSHLRRPRRLMVEREEVSQLSRSRASTTKVVLFCGLVSPHPQSEVVLSTSAPPQSGPQYPQGGPQHPLTRKLVLFASLAHVPPRATRQCAMCGPVKT